MYSPKISEDLIPIIYKKSKVSAKTMTKYIDDLLRPLLVEDYDEVAVYNCSSCRMQVYETDGKKGYCENCECVVFVEKN